MACTRVIPCENVHCTAISSDGQLLAIGLDIGVLLLDARSGVERTRLGESSLAAFSVAFSPASPSQPLQLAAGFSNGFVRVWDCSSGACVAELVGHRYSVLCVAFSPDDRLLASASNDRTVRLWRADDWHAPPTVLEGHTSYVDGVSFSCDGRLLASCSWDGTVRLYILDRSVAVTTAAAAAGPVLKVDKSVFCLAFSPVDSRLLACSGEGRFLAVARVGAGDGTITVERQLHGHTELVRSLAFSPCGRRLVSASYDCTVRLWSVASGACLRVLRGHTERPNGVAFFPSGKQLASCSDDDTVRIWTVCAWSDQSHRLFGASLKAAVFTLMCVRARLEQGQGGPHALQLQFPRLPMEVWLLVFGQLQLALEADGVCPRRG